MYKILINNSITKKKKIKRRCEKGRREEEGEEEGEGEGEGEGEIIRIKDAISRMDEIQSYLHI